MSLQDEAKTAQAVTPTQHSQPRPMISISGRLSVISEKVKAVVARSGWLLTLHTVSRWLLGLSLVLTLSVFSYIALYNLIMPREVEQSDNIISVDCKARNDLDP